MKTNIVRCNLVFMVVSLWWGNAYSSERPLKAIVVGASTGIGRETAKVLASRGYEVGLCSRKIELLNELQNIIPTKTYVKQIDLYEIETVEQKLHEFAAEMGGLDLIVVNAGIATENKDVVPEDRKIPFVGVHDTIRVNVLGCSAAFYFAANYFMQQNYGHIVGISSLDAVRGRAQGPSYCASKAFMGVLLEGLRNKFWQQNIPIDVTEVRPGPIRLSEDEDMGPNVYWVVSSQDVAQDIVDVIEAKAKMAYVPRRWQLIAFLLKITPDWIYNWMGGF
jgi:short-subunit dehydrogenase